MVTICIHDRVRLIFCRSLRWHEEYYSTLVYTFNFGGYDQPVSHPFKTQLIPTLGIKKNLCGKLTHQYPSIGLLFNWINHFDQVAHFDQNFPAVDFLVAIWFLTIVELLVMKDFLVIIGLIVMTTLLVKNYSVTDFSTPVCYIASLWTI